MLKDRGEWNKRALQFLQVTQTELYLQFKQHHPEHTIGQHAFEMLKPSFIRAIKDMERNVCCCRYHVEMVYLKEAFNSMRGHDSTTHPKGVCNCSCSQVCCPEDVTGGPEEDSESTAHSCKASSHATFGSLKSLWEEILRPKGEDEEWHAIECIKGECPSCGIQKLRVS